MWLSLTQGDADMPDAPTFTLTLTEPQLRLLYLALGTLTEANPDDEDVTALDVMVADLVNGATEA